MKYFIVIGKLIKNDHIAVEVLSLNSINKPKTKPVTNIKYDSKNVLKNTLNRNNVLSEEINIEELNEFSDEGKYKYTTIS